MTADSRSARSATHATRRWSGGLAEMLGLAQERQRALTGLGRLTRYTCTWVGSTLLCHHAAECSLIRSRARHKVWRLLSAGAMQSSCTVYSVVIVCREGSHRGCTGELYSRLANNSSSGEAV